MTITLFRTSGVIIPEIRQPTFVLDGRIPSAKLWVLDGISRVKRVPNNNCSIDQPIPTRITYDTNIIVPNVLPPVWWFFLNISANVNPFWT